MSLLTTQNFNLKISIFTHGLLSSVAVKIIYIHIHIFIFSIADFWSEKVKPKVIIILSKVIDRPYNKIKYIFNRNYA